MVTRRSARTSVPFGRLLPVLIALAALAPGALVPAPPACAQGAPDAPDTSEVEALAREDAWSESGGEPGLVAGEDAGAPGDAGAVRAGVRARGRLLVARGAYALWSRVQADGGRAELSGLLAREPGEPRAVDDAYGRLRLAPARGVSLSLGRVDPAAGAGLVLGPARVRPREPARLVSGPAVRETPLVPATPARAATTARGAWLTGAVGRARVGLLVAATRRDATRLDGGLVPRPGARHTSADADAARGRLAERMLALALARGPVYAVVCRREGERFLAAPGNASQAVARASPLVGAGAWAEVGWTGRDPARAALALARDPRGRLAVAASLAPPPDAPGAVTAALECDARDPRYAPPTGRAESRPCAHVAVALAQSPPHGPGAPAGGSPPGWRVEAQALERRPYDPVLAWLTARVAFAGGAWVDLRRDAAPARTVIGFGRAIGIRDGLAWRGELRFDRRGLARERWVVRAVRPLGRRLVAGIEAALGGGRGAGGQAERDVPGGAWVAFGRGDERTRVTLAARGRVAPELTFVRAADARGARTEARLAVRFAATAPVAGAAGAAGDEP